MEINVAEVLTFAARQVAPIVARKGQSFSFDYRGPQLLLDADVVHLRCALHRLLCGAIDCLDSGFVLFSAEARMRQHGARLTVLAAGTGEVADDPTLDGVLDRLGFHRQTRHADSPLPADARVAHGICPKTGASVDFVSVPREGLLFRAVLDTPDAQAMDEVAPLGGHRRASAWLIGVDGGNADTLVRRLQRMGWATRRFGGCAEALAAARECAAAGARLPALAILFDDDTSVAPLAAQLRSALPDEVECVLCVACGSRWLSLDGHATLLGWQVCVHPFSPGELAGFSLAAGVAAYGAMGPTTATASLRFVDRPLVLAVDDNEINRIVARGLLESLGYEVITADDGHEAVLRCGHLAPHAVLMDVNMPVMDGLVATRELRRLQRVGDVPPFAIVAATAASSPEECLAAGMDGYVSKPLQLQSLRAELLRVAMPA